MAYFARIATVSCHVRRWWRKSLLSLIEANHRRISRPTYFYDVNVLFVTICTELEYRVLFTWAIIKYFKIFNSHIFFRLSILDQNLCAWHTLPHSFPPSLHNIKKTKMSGHVEEPRNFAPKDPPKLDPPKDDPISVAELAKHDGVVFISFCLRVLLISNILLLLSCDRFIN